MNFTYNSRIYIFLLHLALCILFVSAQEKNNGIHLDPFLRLALDGSFTNIVTKTAVDRDMYPVVIHGSLHAMRNVREILVLDYGTFGTANLSADEIGWLMTQPGISRIEYAPVHDIQMDVSRTDIRADSIHAGFINNITYTGEGVIIGLIDTGVDFYHDDFRQPNDPNRSRIIKLWDISLTPADGESHPDMFDLGVEYTREQIESDLRGDTNGLVRSRDTNGHGTHVAGIAGGGGRMHDGKYRGVAPESEFIVVKFPGSGITTQELIHGITYIFSEADALNKPAVINLSIGGHGGSHDGTSGHELLIDRYADETGRVVVVAAGNSGALNNYTGSVIPANQSRTFTLNIGDYTPKTQPGENFVLMLLWHEGTDAVRLIIESPTGIHDTVVTADSLRIIDTQDGRITVFTHPHFINPKGARVFEIFLTDTDVPVPPKSGNWRFTISSIVSDTEFQYDSWIAAKSMISATLNPSLGRRNTVSMPGTAEKAVTVGTYHTKLEWVDVTDRIQRESGILYDLAPFSGGGPTRDMRIKPDITAPGRYVGSALSADASYSARSRLKDAGYVVLAGTSISTPHVTGIVALMLEANPSLKTEDILSIIKKSARSDEYAYDVPNNDWGWGKVNALEAVREAAKFVTFVDRITQQPGYYNLGQNYPNPFNPRTTIRFEIPEHQHVRLIVYDVLGRVVSTLVDDELPPSRYEVVFDATKLSSGTYFYRLEGGGTVLTKRMILIR
jgi:minor extracellular serine protease Vpr